MSGANIRDKCLRVGHSKYCGPQWAGPRSTDINYSSKHYKWINTSQFTAVEIIKYFITFQQAGPPDIWTCGILALGTEECP